MNKFKTYILSVALAICFLPFKLCFCPKLKVYFHFYRDDPETPAQGEPKFILFYSVLLQLFPLFCFKCKARGLSATIRRHRTMVTVTQSCCPCLGQYVWKSQPPSIPYQIPHWQYVVEFCNLDVSIFHKGRVALA